jgi:proline iminopeptidase
MRTFLIAVLATFGLAGCSQKIQPAQHTRNNYFDTTGRNDALSGGVKMIAVNTPKGTFHVWTKRVGNNPRVKLLLLHGGPGFTHEYFECFDSYLPKEDIEYYYYDQLGSFYSDQPSDSSLWDTARFVDEVEQVRTALSLDKENFYLLGHSWGGILAMEYALKHQEHVKGLIISNMMSSIPEYSAYAKAVFKSSMDPAILKELLALEAAKDYENPRYMELLIPNHYEKHILRMPYAQWPDPSLRAFKHINPAVYIPMQGPSELDAQGKLATWDRSADLAKLTVPTLVIGAQYDTMDPRHMEMMSQKVAHGRYLYCANGSHLAMYDDQTTYMGGVVHFIEDVDDGRF